MKKYTIESFDKGNVFADAIGADYTNKRKALKELYEIKKGLLEHRNDKFHRNEYLDSMCVDYIQVIATSDTDEDYYKIVKRYEL